jgi:hypothetical protein
MSILVLSSLILILLAVVVVWAWIIGQKSHERRGFEVKPLTQDED